MDKLIIKGVSIEYKDKVYVNCLYIGIGNINRLLNTKIDKFYSYMTVSNCPNFWIVL